MVMPYRLSAAFALLLVFGMGLFVANNTLSLPPEDESQLSAGGVVALLWEQLPDSENIEDRRYLGGEESWQYAYPQGEAGAEAQLTEIESTELDPFIETEYSGGDWGEQFAHSDGEYSSGDSGVYQGEREWESVSGDEGWSDPEYVYEDETIYYVEEESPWYVHAFPGVGQFFQQIIPGAQSGSVQVAAPTFFPAPPPARAPQPPTPSRPVYAQPSCWISAQPMEVGIGGATTLQWSSFYTSRASITGIGEVATAGSRIVQNITSERTFTLNVSGQGGTSSCYTRVTVRALARPASCIISANPDVITRGQPANIAWGSESAVHATLSGTGSVNIRGGIYVRPTQSTNYTLTVYNLENRPNSCTARITVR